MECGENIIVAASCKRHIFARKTSKGLHCFTEILYCEVSHHVIVAGVVSIELIPSLTVPPNGSLMVRAPPGFVLPVPCEGRAAGHGQHIPWILNDFDKFD